MHLLQDKAHVMLCVVSVSVCSEPCLVASPCTHPCVQDLLCCTVLAVALHTQHQQAAARPTFCVLGSLARVMCVHGADVNLGGNLSHQVCCQVRSTLQHNCRPSQ